MAKHNISQKFLDCNGENILFGEKEGSNQEVSYARLDLNQQGELVENLTIVKGEISRLRRGTRAAKQGQRTPKQTANNISREKGVQESWQFLKETK